MTDENRPRFVADAPRFEKAAEPPPPGDDDEYARVEVFGHRLHYGRVIEVERFGAKLLRLDVPTDGDFANGYTTLFYAGSAIFSFTGTTRSAVERANKAMRPAGLLTASPAEADQDEA